MKHWVHFKGICILVIALTLLSACGKKTQVPAADVLPIATLPPATAEALDALLVEAVEKGDKPAVERNLKAGANPMALSPLGPLPSLAAVGGDPDIIGLLGDFGANFNVLDANGLAPIHLAASAGNPAAVSQLLDMGVDVNSLGGAPGVGTPLMAAVQGGNVDTAQLLLDRGAIVDLTGPEGPTPLMTAVDMGNLDMANLLIDNGAMLDLQDPNGFTALHFAALNDDLDMTRLLLDSGADLSILSNEGQTPLEMGTVLPGLDAAELNGLFPEADLSGLDDLLPDVPLP